MKILLIENEIAGKKFTNAHKELILKTSPKSQVLIKNVSSYKKYIENAEIIIPPPIPIDFELAKNLKWIHVTSAGINNLPKTLLESKILITNSSGVHPIPISEQIFAYLLIFARNLNKTFFAQSKSTWLSPNYLSAFELNGKTIGIVGLGKIGEAVAKLAKTFGMQVVAISRTPKKSVKNVDLMLTPKQLNKLLMKSDFVINCLPATPQTQNMFGLSEFSLMKPNSYFINIGRGQTVVEKDLIKALNSKIIAGAGLDVFEVEPLPLSSPLWKIENVIITPHSAGQTPFYMDRVIEIFCKNLKAYDAGKKMPTLVNKKLGY